MSLDTLFLQDLKSKPESIRFGETMAVIDASYDFTPTAFTNGGQENAAGENNGSCKLFAFALLKGLTEQQTLQCFGSYYRDDVLGNPQGVDHQNIRNFMKSGWAGIEFESDALTPKA